MKNVVGNSGFFGFCAQKKPKIDNSRNSFAHNQPVGEPLFDLRKTEMSKVCYGCKRTLTRDMFSKTQWKIAGAFAKCTKCVSDFVAKHNGRMKRDGTDDYESEEEEDDHSDCWHGECNCDDCPCTNFGDSDMEWEINVN